ncbi:hypothetical protein [Duganella sp. HH105]|uniref:hypothetical protein n=1 Tax=Duganella sp. HH105 TaxID=1781067 RepID=UPI000877B0C4|nr:hypothetical protein [Duganella sp. HH105]OEZ56918.1 hypothetical protein DUGA6_47880 [Duganella sp. HH105]
MPPADDAPPSYALPFVVAVSGHRDLHPDDVPAVAAQLYQSIELIAAALPHTPIHFLSALADGADQLFAEQVLALQRACAAREGGGGRRIELVVALPMPFDDYCREQAGGEDGARRDPAGFEAARLAFAARFQRYSACAGKVFVIPPAPPAALLGTPMTRAEAAYAQLTRYLGIHAQLLLAVWDGQSGGEQFPRLPGGTLDLVHALLHGVERDPHRRSRRRFAEPARGNLLHLYSRRAQSSSDGLPAASAAGGARLLRAGGRDGEAVAHWMAPQPEWPGVLAPTLRSWLRAPIRACERWAEHRAWRDAVAHTETRLQRTLDAPALAVLYRTHAAGREIDLLNRLHRQALLAGDAGAAQRYAASLEASGGAFLGSLGQGGAAVPAGATAGATAALPAAQRPGLAPLLQAFRVADVQAERAKRWWRYRWRFMALAVIMASAAPTLRLASGTHGELVESVVFTAGAMCAVGTYLWVALSRRRNAYLDYRALAEGLRCQMYWLCAGEAALVTDHCAQRAGGGMGWVRHALDACLVAPPVPGLAARGVLRGWIDDQRAYLSGAGNRWRRRQHARAIAIGNNMLLSALMMSLAALATTLVFGRSHMLPLILLLAGMKLATGVGAAWLSLATKMGHGETAAQAEQLHKLYGRADAELLRSEGAPCSNAEKEHHARDLAFALGKAVLDENAGWLAAYQQRRLNWHGR